MFVNQSKSDTASLNSQMHSNGIPASAAAKSLLTAYVRGQSAAHQAAVGPAVTWAGAAGPCHEALCRQAGARGGPSRASRLWAEAPARNQRHLKSSSMTQKPDLDCYFATRV